MAQQQTKTTPTTRGRISLDGISLDTLAVLAASLFIILIIAGETRKREGGTPVMPSANRNASARVCVGPAII